jgi:hypothetical protein
MCCPLAFVLKPPIRRAERTGGRKPSVAIWELAAEIGGGAFRVVLVPGHRDIGELLLAFDVSSLGARGPEPLPDDVRLEAGQGADTHHWQPCPDEIPDVTLAALRERGDIDDSPKVSGGSGATARGWIKRFGV